MSPKLSKTKNLAQ